jgi:hypothetical protein
MAMERPGMLISKGAQVVLNDAGNAHAISDLKLILTRQLKKMSKTITKKLR